MTESNIPTELRKAKYISFATLKKDGSYVSTPVWAGMLDGSLYVFSEKSAGKVKRLRNFSQSTIAPCTLTGKVTGNTYVSEAFLLDSKEDIKTAYKALYKKYGFVMGVTDAMSKLTGRYNKRALIRIELATNFKTGDGQENYSEAENTTGAA